MFVVESHAPSRRSACLETALLERRKNVPSILVFCIATPFCLVSASGLPQCPVHPRLGVLQMGLSWGCLRFADLLACLKSLTVSSCAMRTVWASINACHAYCTSSVGQLFNSIELRLSRLRHSPEIEFTKLVSRDFGTKFNAQHRVKALISSFYSNITHAWPGTPHTSPRPTVA
jgi:hypothetical protein